MRFGLVVLLALSGCKKKNGDDEAFGLDERPANPTCVAFDRPDLDASIALERAWPALSFSAPVLLVQAPGDASRWYVVEQGGTVRVFAAAEDTASATLFADLRDRVDDGGEMGLLGLAFHPDFATNGEVFVSYTNADAGRESRVSRFRSLDGGATLDPTSEEIVLEVAQPYSNHNGGHIAFGPDGLLYFGLGDGGSGGDPLGHGQDTDTLLGAMLRIDVDSGDPYGIPADNPFADGIGGAPEIYAWGLRNPWRFSFDPPTGRLWVADVGQNAWEEVDLVERGGNYGWNAKEGTHCYDADEPCDDPSWIDPVAEYSHDEGYSITGGHVWRDTSVPALEGVYLYGDFGTGVIWGLFEAGSELEARELLRSGKNVSTFAQDADGAVLLVDYGGSVWRIVPAVEGTSTVPATLSATGCVDAADPTRPASGLIPYGVNASFWSDDADKERWLAIPDGETIAVRDDGDWDLPVGSVLVKHFRVQGVLAETRLFMRHDDGDWAGYTYAWNADGSDAVWVPAGRTEEVGGQTWHWPTSGECLSCHTTAAGRSLGPETAQLNGSFTYPNGRVANQIATLDHVGLFTSSPGAADELPSLADPYGDAPAEDRARAWLHTNCSSCHRPGGTGGGEMDLRNATALGDMRICGIAPGHGDLGIADAALVAPGDPAASVLLARVRAASVDRMPPLGPLTVDVEGAALLEQWIAGLDGCP